LEQNEGTPIVVDSGASKSIMPDPSEFVGPTMPMDSPIQGLSATTKIKGIGTVRWHMMDSLGTTTTLETSAYYIPEAYIRLFRKYTFQKTRLFHFF